MAKNIRLSCVNFHERETNVVRSLLTVLEPRLKAKFSYSAAHEAQVLLIATDAGDNQSLWAHRHTRFRNAKNFVAYNPAEGLLGEHDVALHAPIRPNELVGVLNDIVDPQQLIETTVSPAPTAPIAESGHAPELGEQTYLYQFLYTGQWADPVHLISADMGMKDCPDLYIDTNASRYYFSGEKEQLHEICKQPIPENAWSIMQESEIETARGAANSGDLDELIWVATICGSAGKPLPHVANASSFKLRRWPDLGRLHSKPECSRLAAFLARHEASLADITRITRVSENIAIDFLNACDISGLLTTTEVAPVVAPSVSTNEDKPRIGLLQAIRSRLGL